MSDYKMDIKGEIGLSEYSNISDYLGIVDCNDDFTITFDKENNSDINIITSILRESEFYIREEGYTEDGKYYINAHKYE